MEFHLKKRKIIFETLFSTPFDVLHSSPIVYLDHRELIFQDLLLYRTKKVAENHNQFFHFCHGGKTHFLVLAQTLIYAMAFFGYLPCLAMSSHSSHSSNLFSHIQPFHLFKAISSHFQPIIYSNVQPCTAIFSLFQPFPAIFSHLYPFQQLLVMSSSSCHVLPILQMFSEFKPFIAISSYFK